MTIYSLIGNLNNRNYSVKSNIKIHLVVVEEITFIHTYITKIHICIRNVEKKKLLLLNLFNKMVIGLLRKDVHISAYTT